MKDPLLGEKLRSILDAVRVDLKPELTGGNAKLRCELIEMLLARLSVEVDAPDLVHEEGIAVECGQRNAIEDRILTLLNTPVEAKGSSAELVISPETFDRWLAAQGIGGRVTSVVTVPGGRSKGTLLLDLEDGRGIVIRRDFSDAVTGTSVADEYPVIAAVHSAGICVPKPLALENSPDVIGGRFIAFEKAPGKAMGTLFASDASPEFCRAFARELAKLHSLDVDALGLSPILEFGEEPNPIAALVAKHEREYRTLMTAQPIMDAAFAWLHAQLPKIGVQRRIVHGDAALHNTMGEGDRLTALLDWEFAHAGDPAQDLAYGRFLISTILPWDEFMNEYYAAGGPEISPQRLSFFIVWRTLVLSVWTGMARASFDSGKDRDLRMAAIGHNTFPRQLRALANDLSQAMIG